MRKAVLFLALLVIGIFLTSACTQQQPANLVGGGTPVPQEQQNTQQNNQQETQQQTQQQEQQQQNAQQAAQEVKEFKITAKQFQFEPATIEVSKGDKVRLLVTSVDVPHGIKIEEYGINQRLDVGKEVVIEFTADKQGTFTAFCSVFCGSGHSNMKGKLIVK